MKRIYLAGSGGMLGKALYEEWSTNSHVRCTDIDVNEPWLDYLDFRDFSAYRDEVRAHDTEVLVHVGAHTSLEFCELNPDEAYSTNVMAVENAVNIANELDIPVIYIGTAGVFDGAKDEYDDWDDPNPLGVYARSKWAGEVFVAQNARRHLICRAGWMMGGGPQKDKKFVQKMMAQIRSGASELRVVNDRLGTPTYTRDFAKNLRLLLDSQHWGLYNMVCQGMTSRLEVAGAIVDILGLTQDVRVVPVDSEHFAREYFAPRPACERLRNRKLELRGLSIMPSWRDSLEHYLLTDYSGYLDSVPA